MGVLRSIVEAFVLSMLDMRYDFFPGGGIACQFVGDDDTRHVLEPLQELTEEFLDCLFVSSTLDKNIKHVAVLIDDPP